MRAIYIIHREKLSKHHCRIIYDTQREYFPVRRTISPEYINKKTNEEGHGYVIGMPLGPYD